MLTLPSKSGSISAEMLGTWQNHQTLFQNAAGCRFGAHSDAQNGQILWCVMGCTLISTWRRLCVKNHWRRGKITADKCGGRAETLSMLGLKVIAVSLSQPGLKSRMRVEAEWISFFQVHLCASFYSCSHVDPTWGGGGSDAESLS